MQTRRSYLSHASRIHKGNLLINRKKTNNPFKDRQNKTTGILENRNQE